MAQMPRSDVVIDGSRRREHDRVRTNSHADRVNETYRANAA